jgi:hypothetical protein
VTVYDKPIVYHDWYLAENTEPLSLHHNDIPPSVVPVRSARPVAPEDGTGVRDILKGDPTHGQNNWRFSGTAQNGPETGPQKPGPLLPSVLPAGPVRAILEVTKFRKTTLSADAESRPAIGLGTDFRLESKKVTGFALVLNDQILHMSVFARVNDRNIHPVDSRIERFSKRRRNWRV